MLLQFDDKFMSIPIDIISYKVKLNALFWSNWTRPI